VARGEFPDCGMTSDRVGCGFPAREINMRLYDYVRVWLLRMYVVNEIVANQDGGSRLKEKRCHAARMT
jgi:hypothetical protein